MCAHLWLTTKCSNCKESKRPGHCERDRKRDHQKSHSLHFPPFKFQFKRRKYYSNFIKFCALTKEVGFGAETEKKYFQVHFIIGLCVCNSVQPNCSKVFEERLKKKLDNEDVKQVERRSQPTKRATSFSLGSANKSWHRARQPASKRIRNINGLWINKWWVISKCSFAQFIHYYYYFTLLYTYFMHSMFVSCRFRGAATQVERTHLLVNHTGIPIYGYFECLDWLRLWHTTKRNASTCTLIVALSVLTWICSARFSFVADGPRAPLARRDFSIQINPIFSLQHHRQQQHIER